MPTNVVAWAGRWILQQVTWMGSCLDGNLRGKTTRDGVVGICFTVTATKSL